MFQVKKWQASLPSINLLGTQSSSDCEDSLQTSKRSRPRSNLRGHSENEINCSLSLELMSKLKISEEPLKSSSCLNIAMCKKKTMSLNLKNISVKNTSTNLGSKREQAKGNAFERVFSETKSKIIKCPNSKFQTHTDSPIPSTSESESQTYLPKSSSWTCTSERQLKSESSDSSDDSSSVSSLTSRESFSLTSSNKSNMKFALRKSKTEGKLPTPYKSNLANTKIVLRKPKLNYEPMTNISNFNIDKVLQKKTQSQSNPKNLKVESSQRKAWNERNTTNFYVCKEFYLKVSLKAFKIIIHVNLICFSTMLFTELQRYWF